MDIRKFRKHLKVKIPYDNTVHSAKAAFCLLACAAILGSISIWLIDLLRTCHESLFRSQFLHGTSAEVNVSCGLPYDDCLCSVQSNRSSNSEDCVYAVQLIVSRITPLMTFIFECFAVRKIFYLGANCTRSFFYFLWILSGLILGGITIGIYWSSCYHRFIIIGLQLTLLLLSVVFGYNFIIVMERDQDERRNDAASRAHVYLLEIYLLERLAIRAAYANHTTSNNEVIPTDNDTSDQEVIPTDNDTSDQEVIPTDNDTSNQEVKYFRDLL